MATDLELFYLEMFNSARSDPPGYAASLGIDLNEGLSEGTLSSEPRQPLKLNSDLVTLATGHSQDMLDNDFMGHDSPTTGSTRDRFDASPYIYALYGENLALVPSSAVVDPFVAAQFMFEGLFVDAGVAGRGHRKNIVTGGFSEIGFGHLIGEWQGYTDSHILTQNFGHRVIGTRGVVGVVFSDSNSGGTFDIGEGMSAIDVAFIQGGTDKYLATTDSNGYFEANILPGPYTVEARTPSHYSTLEIDVLHENIRVLLFWDAVVTEAPTGTFVSDVDKVLANAANSSIQSLNPTNVVQGLRDTYTITWAVQNATFVSLDGTPVSPSGSKTIGTGGPSDHILTAYGPAGSLEKTISIGAIIFVPFTTEDI